MKTELPSAECIIEIPFYDVDPMHVVWHGNYLKYFEKARCVLLDKFDYGYLKMQESGYMWPIVDARVKYVNSAYFGQKILCTAYLSEYENRLKISYEIVCVKTGQRITKGYTVQVAVCITTKEMQLVSPLIVWEKLGVLN